MIAMLKGHKDFGAALVKAGAGASKDTEGGLKAIVERKPHGATSAGAEKEARAEGLPPPVGNANGAADAVERSYAEKDLHAWTVADAEAWMRDECSLTAEDRDRLAADGVDGPRLRELRVKDFRRLGLSCRCCFHQMLRKRDALLS